MLVVSVDGAVTASVARELRTNNALKPIEMELDPGSAGGEQAGFGHFYTFVERMSFKISSARNPISALTIQHR